MTSFTGSLCTDPVSHPGSLYRDPVASFIGSLRTDPVSHPVTSFMGSLCRDPVSHPGSLYTTTTATTTTTTTTTTCSSTTSSSSSSTKWLDLEIATANGYVFSGFKYFVSRGVEVCGLYRLYIYIYIDYTCIIYHNISFYPYIRTYQ